jgi:hypothetical protein
MDIVQSSSLPVFLLNFSTSPFLSSLNVTHTQNHEIISMKRKVNMTRFLRRSPPQVAGT